ADDRPVTALLGLTATGQPVGQFQLEGASDAKLEDFIKAHAAEATTSPFGAYGDDNFVVAAPAGADKSGQAFGTVAIAWRTDELSAQAAALRNTVLATLALGLLAIITMIVLVLRRLVTRPLNDVAQRIRA